MLSQRFPVPAEYGSKRARDTALALIAGAALAAMVLKLGVLSLGVVIVLLALPWIVREPFSLYLLLIVTWPVATLYLHVSLPAGIPDLNFERGIVAAMLALVILPALRWRRELPGLAWPVLLAAVAQFTAFAFAIVGRPVVEPDLVILLNAVALPVIMYWMTKVFIRSRRRLAWLLYAIIAGSLIVCATGLYERVFDLRESAFPVVTGTASGARYLDVARGRAAGVVGNPAVFGPIVGIGALASLCCFGHSTGKKGRMFFAAAAFMLLYGVFVSYTRSAWMAFAVAFGLAQILIKGLWRWTVLGVLLAVLLGGLYMAGSQDLPTNSEVSDRLLEQRNVTGRIERIVFSWDKFMDRPLSGWGPGALDALIRKSYPEKGFNTSHNTYLTLLVDGGMFTFASFAVVIVFWFIQAYRTMQMAAAQSFERSALGVMLGILVIYLVSGAFLELKYFGYLNALFWIAGATIEILAETQHEIVKCSQQGSAWLD